MPFNRQFSGGALARHAHRVRPLSRERRDNVPPFPTFHCALSTAGALPSVSPTGLPLSQDQDQDLCSVFRGGAGTGENFRLAEGPEEIWPNILKGVGESRGGGSPPGMHWRGGEGGVGPPSRPPAYGQATLFLTATASFSGLCNRQ